MNYKLRIEYFYYFKSIVLYIAIVLYGPVFLQ